MSQCNDVRVAHLWACRSAFYVVLAAALSACNDNHGVCMSTEAAAGRTSDVALRADFADMKKSLESLPKPLIRRQEDPMRWLCEYRIDRDVWTVILDPATGRGELSRFGP